MLFTPMGNLGFCGEEGGGDGTGNSPYFFSAAGNRGISGAPGFGRGGAGTVSVFRFQFADANGNCLFFPEPRNASNIIIRRGSNNRSFSNWAFALCFLFIMAT